MSLLSTFFDLLKIIRKRFLPNEHILEVVFLNDYEKSKGRFDILSSVNDTVVRL